MVTLPLVWVIHSDINLIPLRTIVYGDNHTVQVWIQCITRYVIFSIISGYGLVKIENFQVNQLVTEHYVITTYVYVNIECCWELIFD